MGGGGFWRNGTALTLALRRLAVLGSIRAVCGTDGSVRPAGLPGLLHGSLHVQVLDQKRPLVGDLLDHLGGWLAGAVAGSRLDTRQHRGGTRLSVLKGGDELEA